MVRVASKGALIVIILSMINGCRKADEQATWDVDMLAPLARTTLTVRDLVADSLLDLDANNGLSIAFNSELFALELDTVLEIPDTTYAYRYALPIPGPVTIGGGVTLFDLDDATVFGIDPIALSEVDVRTGFLEVEVVSMVNTNTTASFSLTSADFNGQPVQLTMAIPPGTPSNPAVVTELRDISGHHFDLRGPNFSQVNTLSNTLTFATAVGANTVDITDQDSLIAFIRYIDIVPDYARGFFGTRTVEVGPEQNAFDAFEAVVGGSIDLDQVTMTLSIINGIGVDVQGYLQYFSSVNNASGTTIDLQHSITNGPVNISRALDLGNGFAPTYLEIVMDNANSNVDLFLENLPDRLDLAMDLEIDPLGNISNGNDFLYYDSELRVDLEAVVPLCIIASDLALQSVVTVDLPGTTGSHGLQYGTLKLFATNGFPFDAEVILEIYANGQVFANIPVNGQVAAGLVDANFDVTGSVNSVLTAELGADDVDLLYQAQRMRITVVFNTPPSQHVKLRDHYELEMQLTGDFNYVINGDG